MRHFEELVLPLLPNDTKRNLKDEHITFKSVHSVGDLTGLVDQNWQMKNARNFWWNNRGPNHQVTTYIGLLLQPAFTIDRKHLHTDSNMFDLTNEVWSSLRELFLALYRNPLLKQVHNYYPTEVTYSLLLSVQTILKAGVIARVFCRRCFTRAFQTKRQ